jgi:diguanylate cyclase (GGDEF)-like protein/PAS domain S-box-containing protein
MVTQLINPAYRLFSALADTVSEPVWVVSIYGTLDFANKHWLDFTGTDIAHMGSLEWLHIIDSEDRAPVAALWANKSVERAAYSFECRLVSKRTAKRQTYRISANPVFDEANVLVQWIFIAYLLEPPIPASWQRSSEWEQVPAHLLSNLDALEGELHRAREVIQNLHLDAWRLEEIAKTQEKLFSPDFNLEEFYGHIVTKLDLLTGGAGSVIELTDGEEMVYSAGSGLAADYVGLRLKRNNSLSGYCVELKRSLTCEDAEVDSRVDREACRRIGVRSMVVTPLWGEGRVVGVLKVMSHEPRHFVQRDLQTLELMAGFIGVGIAQKQAALERERMLDERARNLEETAATATRIRAIVESSQDAFVSVGAQGTITEWNHQAEILFGWQAHEALGQTLDELIIPEAQREAHRRGWAAFQRTGMGPIIGVRVEVEALRRDGSTVPVELSVSASWTGSHYIANAFIHDVSERRRNQQLLIASERRLRMITDNLPAMIGYVDQNLRYSFANETYRTMLGIDPQWMLGQHVKDVLGQEAYEIIKHRMDAALKGERVHFEREGMLADRSIYVMTDYIPDIAEDGSVLGFYVMVTDITARKAAESKRTESEKRLKAIADNLPVLIGHIDENRCFDFANATFETWLGISAEACLGQHVSKVVDKSLYAERKAQLDLAYAGKTVKFEMKMELLGTVRYLQTTYIPEWRDGKVCGVYALSSDVTQNKLFEQQLLHLARHDALTGLVNRRYFLERLHDALLRSQRSHNSVALFYLDLDYFKAINDTYGHGVGDDVLREFAYRLRQGLREIDIVARYAGDEFLILIEGAKDVDAKRIAQKILDNMHSPVVLKDASLKLQTSIGIAFCSWTDGSNAEHLLSVADAALYEAKRSGRGQFCFKLTHG